MAGTSTPIAPNHFSARIALLEHVQPGASIHKGLQDKPLYALHNPVTLHVVCARMLLRSEMEA